MKSRKVLFSTALVAGVSIGLVDSVSAWQAAGGAAGAGGGGAAGSGAASGGSSAAANVSGGGSVGGMRGTGSVGGAIGRGGTTANPLAGRRGTIGAAEANAAGQNFGSTAAGVANDGSFGSASGNVGNNGQINLGTQQGAGSTAQSAAQGRLNAQRAARARRNQLGNSMNAPNPSDVARQRASQQSRFRRDQSTPTSDDQTSIGDRDEFFGDNDRPTPDNGWQVQRGQRGRMSAGDRSGSDNGMVDSDANTRAQRRSASRQSRGADSTATSQSSRSTRGSSSTGNDSEFDDHSGRNSSDTTGDDVTGGVTTSDGLQVNGDIVSPRSSSTRSSSALNSANSIGSSGSTRSSRAATRANQATAGDIEARFGQRNNVGFDDGRTQLTGDDLQNENTATSTSPNFSSGGNVVSGGTNAGRLRSRTATTPDNASDFRRDTTNFDPNRTGTTNSSRATSTGRRNRADVESRFGRQNNIGYGLDGRRQLTGDDLQNDDTGTSNSPNARSAGNVISGGTNAGRMPRGTTRSNATSTTTNNGSTVLDEGSSILSNDGFTGTGTSGIGSFVTGDTVGGGTTGGAFGTGVSGSTSTQTSANRADDLFDDLRDDRMNRRDDSGRYQPPTSQPPADISLDPGLGATDTAMDNRTGFASRDFSDFEPRSGRDTGSGDNAFDRNDRGQRNRYGTAGSSARRRSVNNSNRNLQDASGATGSNNATPGRSSKVLGDNQTSTSSATGKRQGSGLVPSSTPNNPPRQRTPY